jgi:hypothetical protein
MDEEKLRLAGKRCYPKTSRFILRSEVPVAVRTGRP